VGVPRAETFMNQVLQYLRGLALATSGEEITDGGLLKRFVASHEEAAFEELLRRHGPMVLSVCRNLLRNGHDAEDAFQATFLILVRRARSLLSRGCVGSWLCAVAYRTAVCARRAAARRVKREERAVAMLTSDDRDQAPTDRELHSVLCEEVNRLAEKYRAPIVLCYLEGKTNEEAARRLGCPKGTVLSRLARGRDKLRSRLVRRGITLSATGLAAALTASASAAAAPALLADTIKAALFVAGNPAAAVLPPHIVKLTEGVLKAMFLTKLKSTAVVLLGLVLAGACLSLLAYQRWTADTAQGQQAAGPASRAFPAQKESDKPKSDNKSRTEPAGVPLEARLIAKKDTYVLDLGGKTPEEVRKLLNNDPFPQAPAVDLELEFRNSGNKDLTFQIDGTYPGMPLYFKLEGPGAENRTWSAPPAPVAGARPVQVTLAPGKTHTLAFTELKTFRGGRDGTACCWTEPGDYTLTATLETMVSPVPPGSKDYNGFGVVKVISASVKLKVTAEKQDK